MRWSIPIGRVFGITVRLHLTFLLLLAFIAYQGFVGAGVHGAFWALALVCSVFLCIGLHELGHSIVAQQLGVQVKSITLLPIGGVAALRTIPENPWHEIAITLAGPLVNAVIALLLLPFTGLPSELFIAYWPHDFAGLLKTLVGTNILLFAFNFIPAFPMDGGRLLRAVLAIFLSHRRATVIAASVGQGLAIVFFLVGLKTGHLGLMLIGGFIFIAAEGEEKMVRVRSLLREIDVEEVMSRDFATLLPQDSVSRGLEMIYQTGQDAFPVLDHSQFVGFVTRELIVKAVKENPEASTIAEIMESNMPVVSPHEKVAEVYEGMLAEGVASFPVIENGKIVGLVGLENISRYLVVQSSIKPSRRKNRSSRVASVHTGAQPPVIVNVPPVVTPPHLEAPAQSLDPVDNPKPVDPSQ